MPCRYASYIERQRAAHLLRTSGLWSRAEAFQRFVVTSLAHVPNEGEGLKRLPVLNAWQAEVVDGTWEWRTRKCLY